MARTKLRHMPVRLATGAFIVNSGVGKLQADDETAARVHAMASGAYPMFGNLGPGFFTRALGSAEVALGTALVVPLVPTAVAAAGLTAFSAGLLRLYARTPGLRQEGSWRPTQQGTAVAKDVWLLGIGLSLLADRAGARRRRNRARRAKAKSARVS